MNPGNPNPASEPPHASSAPRRNFLTEVLAWCVGSIVALVPAVVGVLSFLNPLRSSVKARQRPSGSDADGFYQVTSVDALPTTPQAFKIIADRKDAWNTFPNEAIGAVFLQRAGDGEVRAFNATCPHAGCSVDFRPDMHEYFCPCHNSAFTLEGKRSDTSPSPRDLDSLPVKIEDGKVLVKFQDFQTGHAEKKPL